MKTCLKLYHHSSFVDGVNPARKINVELSLFFFFFFCFFCFFCFFFGVIRFLDVSKFRRTGLAAEGPRVKTGRRS